MLQNKSSDWNTVKIAKKGNSNFLCANKHLIYVSFDYLNLISCLFKTDGKS